MFFLAALSIPFQLSHKTTDGFAFPLVGRALHHIAGLLHHGLDGVMPGIPAVTAIDAPFIAIAIPAIVPADIVAAALAGAAAIGVTRVAAVLLRRTDFFDILDGVGELVGRLQVASTQFSLSGQLLQPSGKPNQSLRHIYHWLCHGASSMVDSL